MYRSAIVSAAFAAAAVAQDVGTAHIINGCGYDVHLSAVPAGGPGETITNDVLSAGDSWSQDWTMLSNTGGWSLKLSKDEQFGHNLLQYEYTFHEGDTIWYDLSQVDGNPWDGNWEITASGDCQPRQAAYRYATDDAYGMQSCPAESSITVTLCSAESQNDDLAEAVSASPDAAPSVASGSNDSADEGSNDEAATAAPTPESTNYGGWQNGGENAAVAPQPTTMATRVVAANANGNPAVEIQTAYETQWVTASPQEKRHEHHPRHPHQRV